MRNFIFYQPSKQPPAAELSRSWPFKNLLNGIQMAVASTSIFLAAAFPQAVHANVNWDSGFQIVYNDPCDGCFHLEAFSWNGPQVGDATVNLEIYDVSSNTWQVVLSENYNYLEGVYDFSLCIDLIDVPWGKQDYRVQFEFLVDGNCPTGQWNGEHYIWYSNSVTVHIANYPTPPEFNITNSQAGSNNTRIVDNCGEITYTLNFNYIPNAEYSGEYTIWESDATGSKIAPIITRDQGSWINFITFDQLIGLLQGDFSNLIDPTVGLPGYQGYNGFVLIELELEHTLNCGYSPHTRDLLVQINEQPFIAGFDFRYEDPNGNPTGPTQYLTFAPSQDAFNPTQIGGGTGAIAARATTPFYSSWSLEIYWVQISGTGVNEILVGEENGTSILTPNFARRVCHTNLYGGNFLNIDPATPTNIPCDNYNQTYKAVLTLSSIGCGSSSFEGNFTVPFGLRNNKSEDLGLFYNADQVVITGLTSDAYSARIVGLTGQELGAAKASQNTILIEQSLPRGVYLIEVLNTESEVVWVQKLLK